MIKKLNRTDGILLLLAFVASLSFVFIFSNSTSPLFPNYYGETDSSQFMTMGKAWTEGLIPYRDMFDHKGPLIFFVNAVGFFIAGGNKGGVACVQVVFLFATLLGLFKIAQVFKKGKSFSVICVLIAMVLMLLNYVQGNTVEEYCLPFLTWSLYGLLLFFYGNQSCHDWRWALLYGATAGVCVLTRPTNFVPLIAGILIISVILVKKRNFKNLLQNAGAFLAAFAVSIAPFAIYFASLGLWNEAIYAIFEYNIAYAAGAVPWYNNPKISIIDFSYRYFSFFIIFVVAGFRFYHRDFKLGVFYLLTGLFEGILFLKGWGFDQYPLICLPQAILFLNEIVNLTESRRGAVSRFVGVLLIVVLFSVMNFSYESSFSRPFEYRLQYSASYQRDWECLTNEIPKEDSQAFVACGDNELKEAYLVTNWMPCYKYFSIQPWMSAFSDEMKDNIHSTFGSCEAKWILTDEKTEPLDDILESRYELYDSSGVYSLFKLKE